MTQQQEAAALVEWLHKTRLYEGSGEAAGEMLEQAADTITALTARVAEVERERDACRTLLETLEVLPAAIRAASNPKETT